MKKNCLVFIPTGLNSPEVEVLSASAQKLINEGSNVTILVCKGGKNYHCAKNVFSINSICSLCIKRRTKIINNIKGNFKLVETPEIPNPKKLKIFKNFMKLKKHKINNIDSGLAAYSSYLDKSRDKDLHGFFAKWTISRLVYTTDFLTNFYDIFLKKNKFNLQVTFNGRMNLYRPLFRLGAKYKVELKNLETLHDGKKLVVHNLKDALINDYDQMPKLMNEHWEKNKRKQNSRKFFADKFYNNVKKFNTQMENPKSFLSSQKKNFLPKNWDFNKFNICYYVSSEDEYESIVKKKNDSIFKNQFESIIEISKIVKNIKNINFYIRMHPNLEKIKWSYVSDILKIKGMYQNSFIIDSNSPVSTHALMKEVNLVIGLRSRTLLEATYINKPTIIVGRSYWDTLGPFIKIKNKIQLSNLILSKKVKCYGNLAASKYAYFWLTHGKSINYVSGKYFWSHDKKIVKPKYKFNKKSVEFSKVELFLYYLSKSVEKFLINLNYYLSKK